MSWFKNLFTKNELHIHVNVPDTLEFTGEKDLLAFKAIMDEVVNEISNAEIDTRLMGYSFSDYTYTNKNLRKLGERLQEIKNYNLNHYLNKLKLNGSEAEYLIHKKINSLNQKEYDEYIKNAFIQIIYDNCHWGEAKDMLKEQQIEAINNMIQNDEISELLRGVLQDNFNKFLSTQQGMI